MRKQETTTDRLGAFSDCVIAVIITIMVLELKAFDKTTFSALLPPQDAANNPSRRHRPGHAPKQITPLIDFKRLLNPEGEMPWLPSTIALPMWTV
jgi:Endosomal/lysosomal potassium channel TMEM175